MNFVASRNVSGFQSVWMDRFEDFVMVKHECLPSLLKLIDKVDENGGVVHSRLWEGVDTKVTLECKFGHVWIGTARNTLYQEAWCPICAHDAQWKGRNPERPRRSFKMLLELAGASGVKHIGNATNLREATDWQCRCGYTWEEPGRAILIRGYCCQRCDGRFARQLEKAKAVAKERGGECLSTEYLNNRSVLEWMCGEGHTWEAPYNRVVDSGTWCLLCSHEAKKKKDQ